MFNEIKTGIKNEITAEFGEETVIYEENVLEDASKPYFTVKCEKSACEQKRNERRNYRNRFLVKYVSADANKPNEDCQEKAESLLFALESITTAYGLLRGMDMELSMGEGEVTLGVNYDVSLYQTKAEADIMSKLELQGEIFGKTSDFA